jgi:membrane protein implicated in regulation of membrane protease activity
LALAVPLSRFTSRAGGGSAFFVRHQKHIKNMKARDWFGLIIRVVGFLLLPYSAWYLAWAVQGVFTGGYIVAYLLQGVLFAVLGILFLCIARHIVRFTYPDNKNDSDA